MENGTIDGNGWTLIAGEARTTPRALFAIEGNADERGTEEWYIALADKRATAVEQYLEHLGVSNAHLKTVSYGKERLLCDQHNEDCWSKNRRAALKSQVSN